MRFAAKSLPLIAVFLAAFTAAAAEQKPVQPLPADPLHAWVQGSDPAALEAWVNARLDEEKADVAKLVAVQGPRTLKNTLRPFDDAANQLALAGNNAYLIYSLADAAPMRDKGQALAAKVSSAPT